MLEPKTCLPGRRHPIPDAPKQGAVHFVTKRPIYPPFPEGTEMISICMGCFWCSEGLFWDLNGVHSTHVGYQQGCTPNPTYREVCTKRTNHAEVTRIVFYPKKCPLEKILKIFFETHDPTQVMGQGGDRGTQYRSGIYYYEEKHYPIIQAALKAYQGALSKKGYGKIQTEVQPAERFYYAEDYHQQYDAKPGNREYCGLRPTGVTMPALDLSSTKSKAVEDMKVQEEGADAKATGAGRRLFKFEKLQQRDGAEIEVSAALNDKIVAYYHSAHWCGPCKKFTPKLAEIYQSLSAEEKGRFEIVWRSNDRSEEEYNAYFKSMPWLAVPFKKLKKSAGNANKHIPSLVVYARDGKGITKGGVKEISKEAIRKWCGLDLPKETAGKWEIPVLGGEEIMSQKANGTTEKPPMKPLRWDCDWKKANKICCFNRHFAEHSGYFRRSKWGVEVNTKGTTTYYDSVTGKPLFRAPIGRTFRQFLDESEKHGWPSFRDAEVIWDDVRVLKNGEVVSVAGTHLGHNLPDGRGNRYCINLVSIAGMPPKSEAGNVELKKPTGNKLVSLATYIEKGHINYERLLRSETGKTKLLECVSYVERMNLESLKNEEVLCFFMNAYNIMCLKGIMEVVEKNGIEYEGHTSISKRYSFFIKTEHLVAGTPISLYDLENNHIRKMGDPRCHMYLNCASIGCPFFPTTWLTPENLEEVLEAATHAFINEQQAVILTTTGTKAASEIKKSSSSGPQAQEQEGPVIGKEKIMEPKAHGTCEKAPMMPLRWSCDYETADRICCFNRHFAEFAGYWMQTPFMAEAKKAKKSKQTVTFYDSVYGYPLFKAPVGRSWKQFLRETSDHGWPSFRDGEVIWKHTRVLPNGEVVSEGGTHLGHNLPDSEGNRYCINLVSIAGEQSGRSPSETKNEDGDSKSSGGGISDIKHLLLNVFAKDHVKDRRYLLKKYKKCFIGKDLVDWMIMRDELVVEHKDKTRMLTRADAVAIAQDLLNTGFLAHVVGEHAFADKHLFYRFQRDGGAQRRSGKPPKGPMLLVSNIFKWYKSDFEAKYGGLFPFIRKYHKQLKGDKTWGKLSDKDVTFQYQLYDWRLNSVENGKRVKPLLFGSTATTVTVSTSVSEAAV